MATTFDGTRLEVQALGPFSGQASLRAALECQPL
jgi:hypothetical protein